jgi:hypothetical protein
MEVAVEVVLHTYVPPPDAVSVVFCPLQIELEPAIKAVRVLMLTVTVVVLEQPFALVPVTV